MAQLYPEGSIIEPPPLETPSIDGGEERDVPFQPERDGSPFPVDFSHGMCEYVSHETETGVPV